MDASAQRLTWACCASTSALAARVACAAWRRPWRRASDLERSYTDLFAGRVASPTYREKFLSDSFRYPQGFKLDSRKVHLPKIGWVGFWFWIKAGARFVALLLPYVQECGAFVDSIRGSAPARMPARQMALPQLRWEGWHNVPGPRSSAAGYRLASRTYCDHLNACV